MREALSSEDYESALDIFTFIRNLSKRYSEIPLVQVSIFCFILLMSVYCIIYLYSMLLNKYRYDCDGYVCVCVLVVL